MNNNMNLISFFSGCGGLDLGFKQAGFNITWANDNSPSIWETYNNNFPETTLSTQSITNIDIKSLPQDTIGIIGGPPCQSWSNAGKKRGMEDPRGKLFLSFINIIKEQQPYFVLAENVKGLLSARNKSSYEDICKSFDDAGYDLFVKCLNASNYGVPQNRERVIFIGFRKDLKIKYEFPQPLIEKKTVRHAISDLQRSAVAVNNANNCLFPNHVYWEGGFSYIFMSRNRVLDWNGQAFTIQASGRQTSIHPQAPAMIKVEKDVCMFSEEHASLYRRLTVRECARLQTFPDDFLFHYTNINNGYKMIGNAVPVELARHLAESIKVHIAPIIEKKTNDIRHIKIPMSAMV